MVYGPRKKKISQFTAGTAITDNVKYSSLQDGINKTFTQQQLIDDFADVYGASLRTFEFESDLVVSDIQIDEYCIVEENRYTLYKITSAAANLPNIALDSGFTAERVRILQQASPSTYAEILTENPDLYAADDVIYLSGDGIADNFVVTTGAIPDSTTGVLLSNATWNAAGKHLARVYHGAVYDTWFETNGDGSTDDTSKIQAMLDIGGELIFTKAEYAADGLTTDPTKSYDIKSLVGSKFIGTDTILTVGATTVLTATVSASIAFGDTDITLTSVTGIEPGMLLVLRSTESFEETERSGTKDCSFIIDGVSGSDVSVRTSSRMSMTTTAQTITATVYQNKPVKISNIDIDSTESAGDHGIHLLNVANVEISRMKVSDPTETDRRLDTDYSGIQLSRCGNVVLKHCSFSYMSYAVYFLGTVNCLMEDCHAYFCRHLQNCAVGAAKTKMYRCTAQDCYAGLDSHQEAMDTIFEECETAGDTVPNKFRGRRDYIINCDLGAASFETDDGLKTHADFADGETQSYFIVKYVSGGTIGPDTTGETILAEAFHLIMENVNFLQTLFTGDSRYLSIRDCVFDSQGTANCRLPYATVKADYTNVTAYGGGSAVRAINHLTDGATAQLNVDGCLFDDFDIAIRFSSGGDRPYWNIRNTSITNCTTAAIQAAAALDIGAIDNMYFTGNGADLSGTIAKSSSSYTLT